jgi:ankyrin repeat protein
MHNAAKLGHADALVAIVEKGGDPFAVNEKKQSPLHLAAQKGHGDVCAALVKLGADPNLIDVDGRSARGLAKDAGHAHITPLIDACVNSLLASRAIDRMLGHEKNTESRAKGISP